MKRKNTLTRHDQILFITQFGILLAIEVIFCFTPLGSIPFTPLIVATLALIPVIITSIILGTWAGTFMGFLTGIFSLIVWSFMPPNPPIAFVFTPAYEPGNFLSLIIVILPRMLTGLFTGLVYQFLTKTLETKKIQNVFSFTISSIVGSLTNTIGVLGLIYLFFGRSYAAALNIEFKSLIYAILTVVATNGLIEAALAVIATNAICLSLKKIKL